MSFATAPRKPFRTSLRKLRSYAYLGAIEAAKSLSQNRVNVIQRAVYYPVCHDIETLGDLVNRASWFFPGAPFSQVEVLIPVDKGLLNTDFSVLTPPVHQQSYIGKWKNIRLVDSVRGNLGQSDLIVQWKWKMRSFLDPHVIRHLAKVVVADPWFFYSFESIALSRMCARTIGTEQKAELLELSKHNYSELMKQVTGFKKGYLFGTGPSLDRAEEFDFSDGFRIVCNTIVKNKERMNHIKPHVLVLTDSAYHFGPSVYAAAVRRGSVEAVKEHQCYLMVPEHHMPLVIAHNPELEDKIIGMPAPSVWDMSFRQIAAMMIRRPTKAPWPTEIVGHGAKYNFPTIDRFYVRPGPSVMPAFMIPVASSICDDMYIMGVDGRKPDENFYWSHSPSSQFGEIMESLFETHPSMFRDTIYSGMYEEHVEYLEEFLTYGESLGKHYYSLTPSYNPAMAKRLVS